MVPTAPEIAPRARRGVQFPSGCGRSGVWIRDSLRTSAWPSRFHPLDFICRRFRRLCGVCICAAVAPKSVLSSRFRLRGDLSSLARFARCDDERREGCRLLHPVFQPSLLLPVSSDPGLADRRGRFPRACGSGSLIGASLGMDPGHRDGDCRLHHGSLAANISRAPNAIMTVPAMRLTGRCARA